MQIIVALAHFLANNASSLKRLNDMSAKLKKFSHIPGVHCSSTCIQDLARFDSIEISEAMAFGLGEGLGFVFYRDSSLSPVSRFNGRASNLEDKFYRRIGQPISWVGKWDLPLLIKSIQDGRPILAKTFLAHLPYYDPADFPGHGVILTAIDEKAEQVTLADSISEQLLTITIEQFKKATAMDCPPLMAPFSWSAAPAIAFKVDAELLQGAILSMANTMLHPPEKNEGFDAMNAAIDDIIHWEKDDDWKWHARFAYQSIEKRGTGGGGFRLLYADFLQEASRYLPELNALNIESGFRKSAELWQALAATLKQAFAEELKDNFNTAAGQLEQIKQLETTLCTTIIRHLK